MKRATWSLLIVLGALIGCETGPGGGGSLLTPKADTPEAKEQYTILLQTVHSPTHVAVARRIQTYVKDTAGLGDAFVVHKANHSEVYLGRYDSKDAAQDDLRKAKTLRVGRNMPFTKAIIVPMPGQDSSTDNLDLRNAQGAYSVAVATFYDIPDRRYTGHQRRAMEMAKALRAKGVEAYYLIEPARSTVTIGTFPAGAVQTRRQSVYNPRTGDRFFQDVKVVVDKRVDETINEWGAQYEKNDGTLGKGALLVCGNIEWTNQIAPKTGKMEKVVQRCHLVRIPSLNAETGGALPGSRLP